jgi:hypothetical protein
LIANDFKSLTQHTAEIQAVVADNYRLEEERKRLSDQLAAKMGLTSQNPTLSKLAEGLGEPVASRLRALRAQAIAVISDVQRQNRINSEMLKYCSNLMDSVLKDLFEPKAGPSVYSGAGISSRETSAAVLFDHHI